MKAIVGILFMLILNTLFFFVNVGMAEVNPYLEDNALVNYNDSFMKNYNKGTEANPVLTEFNHDELPSKVGGTSSGVFSGVADWFVDVFATISGWLVGVGQGFLYLVNFINSVPNFLSAIGLPGVVVFGFGFLWHTLSIFLVVMFLRGDA
jgi:hypothetical protein